MIRCNAELSPGIRCTQPEGHEPPHRVIVEWVTFAEPEVWLEKPAEEVA